MKKSTKESQMNWLAHFVPRILMFLDCAATLTPTTAWRLNPGYFPFQLLLFFARESSEIRVNGVSER